MHSPPNLSGLSAQKAEKVSTPSFSVGGSSLKIMIFLVHVYRRTSSHPFDVIMAPAKQRRVYEGGFPDMVAIRAEAKGKVQTT